MYWGVVLEFTTAGKVSRSSVSPDQVKALVENIETLDATAFQSDHALQREMIFSVTITGKKPLGIPLIVLVLPAYCVDQNCNSGKIHMPSSDL